MIRNPTDREDPKAYLADAVEINAAEKMVEEVAPALAEQQSFISTWPLANQRLLRMTCVRDDQARGRRSGVKSPRRGAWRNGPRRNGSGSTGLRRKSGGS